MRNGSFNGLAVALAAASLFLGSFQPCAGQGTPVPVWEKQQDKDVVIVRDLAAKSQKWDEEQWRKAFRVSVEPEALTASFELPAMQGRYEFAETKVTFIPRYPLTPGVKYRAALQLDILPGYPGKPPLKTAVYAPAPPNLTPTTVVAQIYPSADVLPENLLKFYIHFSAPMSGGHIYDHIRLLNSAGKPVELPFLEIDEELWNPEMTRLTLFIDPGRIKREVKPLEDIGPALEAGKTFTLTIDSRWRDGKGAPLKAVFAKQFQVTAPDRTPPDPKDWRFTVPRAGSNSPLVLDFNKPMDHALAQRMMQVVSPEKTLVPGKIHLEKNEKRWIFTPELAWKAGTYSVQVQTAIEDLSGNNIGKPFEVDLFEGVEKRIKNETISLPFTVKPAP